MPGIGPIAMIGDLPIYVALDSADVWVHHQQFQLGNDRRPVKVAGVPPDAFSADGQLWGNPLYRWDVMEEDGFSWWKRRMTFAAKRYDRVRIDHFIGIVGSFSIPAGEETAVNGTWSRAWKKVQPSDSPVIMPPDHCRGFGGFVKNMSDLRDQMGYPGMKIMQFWIRRQSL